VSVKVGWPTGSESRTTSPCRARAGNAEWRLRESHVLSDAAPEAETKRQECPLLFLQQLAITLRLWIGPGFERIKERHGAYGSWAVWAPQGERPSSNVGDLSVLDPDLNPALLGNLKEDVVMLGLVLSSEVTFSSPFENFHFGSSTTKDFKIRHAFVGTHYWGAYMTDIVKGISELESGTLRERLREDPSILESSIETLFQEFEDLGCATPTLVALGADAYKLAHDHIPRSHRRQLFKVRHYSTYGKQEEYRRRVHDELEAQGAL